MHIPTFKMPTIILVWQLIQQGDYSFDLKKLVGFSPHLLNPYYFSADARVFFIIYLDDILVLTHSKHAGKRAHTCLCSLLIYLGLCIDFSMSGQLPHLPL